MSRGVYKLIVGGVFYLGSSASIENRVQEHRWMLQKGTHPNGPLQLEYDLYESSEFEILKLTKGDLKAAEQRFLNKHFGKGRCANLSSSSRYNSRIGEVMREKWRDPEYRAAMRLKMAARAPATAETREKMRVQKTGANNARARRVRLHWEGDTWEFPTATDAAKHLGVPQQVIDLWLRGKVAWPGGGRRPHNAAAKQWIGLTGEYADSITCYNKQ